MTLRRLIRGAVLLAVLSAAGCGSPSPSGGEPKPLPPGRIPKDHGPKGR
jgi:hypothetical protein